MILTMQQRDDLRTLQDRYIVWAERRNVGDDDHVIKSYITGEFITLGDLRTTLYPKWADYFAETVATMPEPVDHCPHGNPEHDFCPICDAPNRCPECGQINGYHADECSTHAVCPHGVTYANGNEDAFCPQCDLQPGLVIEEETGEPVPVADTYRTSAEYRDALTAATRYARALECGKRSEKLRRRCMAANARLRDACERNGLWFPTINGEIQHAAYRQATGG